MAVRYLSAVVLVLALGGLPFPARAGLFTGTFVGSIDSAEQDNKLGVRVGDTFSVSVSIDPDLTETQGRTVFFSNDPDDPSFLRLQIGGRTFDEQDDPLFGEGFPLVFLSDDLTRIVGVDFAGDLGIAGGRNEAVIRTLVGGNGRAVFTLEEDIETNLRVTVVGSIHFVPEPPLLMLLGLGLAALRRHFRRPSITPAFSSPFANRS
jgi:hypothetical protein